ncbi:MAG: chromate transporter [Lachnospiraceae bacterium]|nr:chromate transporter [Lachnospiraceae bacterium]
MNEKRADKTSLLSLFLTFAKVGVMTFGGGYAMLPILQREVVENKGWTTEEELSDYFAVGQCTPGVIAVNTSTFIGYKNRGIPGGIAATLGVVFPSLVIITSLAGIIKAFSENIYVTKAFAGIRACVCVLIFNSVVKLFKGAVKDPTALIIYLAAVVLSVFLKVSPVLIVLMDLAFGLVTWALFIRGKESGSQGTGTVPANEAPDEGSESRGSVDEETDEDPASHGYVSDGTDEGPASHGYVDDGTDEGPASHGSSGKEAL